MGKVGCGSWSKLDQELGAGWDQVEADVGRTLS
jgi:hypothetical protein